MTQTDSDLEELKDLQSEANKHRATRNKARATRKKARSTAEEAEAQPQPVATPPTPQTDKVSTESVGDELPDTTQPQDEEATIGGFVEQVGITVKEVEELASERPMLALLAAFSLGLVVGQLLSRK
ncbi:hypothetical protein NOR53_2677 [gamma proteobacterium NOR5-3]|nr:hypothetical protein NOR53_2677 [gamma proteobacterium NOR5-3]